MISFVGNNRSSYCFTDPKNRSGPLFGIFKEVPEQGHVPSLAKPPRTGERDTDILEKRENPRFKGA